MNINNSVRFNNNQDIKADKKNQSNPNFKGLLDIPGAAMNAIEKGGFAASFIIQDTAGMTVPRTKEGLERGIDEERKKATWNVIKARLMFRKPKEEDLQKSLKLKDLNFKEGLEVGIREGLSGPFMMFAPMLALALGKKYVGKSSFSNSTLIKRLGKKLTNVVKETSHDSVEALRKDFYKKSITDMVKSTTKSANAEAEAKFIDKAVSSFERLDAYDKKIAQATGKRKKLYKKAQERVGAKLVEDFNNFHKTNSTDLEMLNRVKFDGEVYATDKAIYGVRAYADDALKNKNISDITEEYTKKHQTASLIKRAGVNLAAAGATIGSLSVVPMLYKMVNPVPPGALGDPTKMENKPFHHSEKKVAENNAPAINNTPAANNTNKNNDGKVSFTGKWDALARNFEFNGNQLTPALMTSLAVGGLMGPRVKTAYNRAPEDPVTHKKDYSEIPEVLTRDVTSTAAVTFGVPMLSKAIIGLYEDSSGFVLRNSKAQPKTTAKKVLDYLNPFSGFKYYEIKDLDQIYGNIDTAEKLGNMSKFIDNNGGNIAKVLKTEKKTAGVFEEFGLDIKALAANKDKKAANATILEKLSNSEFSEKLINAIKPAKKGADNTILKRARTLNSVVSSVATFLLVPVFLGLFLPKMVYKMTENRQKKLRAAQQEAAAAAPAATQTAKVDYAKLKPAASSTFQSMKHS